MGFFTALGMADFSAVADTAMLLFALTCTLSCALIAILDSDALLGADLGFALPFAGTRPCTGVGMCEVETGLTCVPLACAGVLALAWISLVLLDVLNAGEGALELEAELEVGVKF